MCGGGGAPAVVQRDPIADAKKAADDAAAKANADVALRRARKKESSLLATSAQGDISQANTVMSTAKPVLGA